MWLELFPPSLGTLNSLYHIDVFQTFFKLHLTVKNTFYIMTHSEHTHAHTHTNTDLLYPYIHA